MTVICQQPCGHPLTAHHIEQPNEEFLVEWMNPRYVNSDCVFPAAMRWARVWAETLDGALRIARYHYPRGSNFAIRLAPPLYLTPREI